jgi:hypothetical protein
LRIVAAPGPASSARVEPSRLASLGIVIFYGLLGVLCFGPGLKGKYFADDWALSLADPRSHLSRALFELHPFDLYRPLQLWLLAATQTFFGASTLPIHLLELALHVTLAWVVFHVATRLRLGTAAAALAGALVLASQAATAAVVGNDTISLVLGTLTGTAALVLAARIPNRQHAWMAWSSMLLYSISLLSKESSVGYGPLLAAVALTWRREDGALYRRAMFFALGIGALTAAYLIWRSALGGVTYHWGSGQRNVALGFNLPRNAALLWIVAALPVSSDRFLLAVQTHHYVTVVIGVAGLLGYVAVSLRRPRQAWRWVALSIVAGTVLLFPVLVLQHVSELYAYALLPFCALALARGMTAGQARSTGWWALCVGLVVSNGAGAHQKSVLMAENGEAAARLLAPVESLAVALPPHGQLVLVDPPFREPEYSTYRMHGFRLMNDAPIGRLVGRPDISIVYAPTPDLLPVMDRLALAVTLDSTAKVIPLPPDSLRAWRWRAATREATP